MMPMPEAAAIPFELTEDEWNLLVRAVPNEIIRGFRVTNFERRIGTTETHYAEVIRVLEACKQRPRRISQDHRAILQNALAVALSDLDTEFQTRTGYDFALAEHLRRRLSAEGQEPDRITA